MPVEKTVEELFEEYEKWSCEDCTTSMGGRIDSLYNEKNKRMKEIPQEVKSQVRREVVGEIYNIVCERVNELKEERSTNVSDNVDGRYIEVLRTRHDIKEYALSKGITLKN